MIQRVAGRAVVLGLAVVVSMVAYGCQSSSSPTAPAAMESSTSSSQVSADVALGGSQVSMWATVLGKPEVNTDRGLPWVRIEVSYKWSPMGPSSLGLFECRNRLVKRCALLAPKDQIQVMGAEQMESQPKYPMWLIKDFRLIK